MREIKLRAYVEDYPLMNSNGMCDVISIDFKGELVKLYHKGIMAQFEINDVKLMQYTGLNDKNGKEIYEGDILQVFNFKCIVKFGKHEASNGWYAETEEGMMCELNDTFGIAEIIGNIYENPELLKGA